MTPYIFILLIALIAGCISGVVGTGCSILLRPQMLQGLMVGAAVMSGTFAGKGVVLRLSPAVFHFMLDGIMFCSGVSMIWTALV